MDEDGIQVKATSEIQEYGLKPQLWHSLQSGQEFLPF